MPISCVRCESGVGKDAVDADSGEDDGEQCEAGDEQHERRRCATWSATR